MIELIKIPAGAFLMGSPDDEMDRFLNKSPKHEVSVPEFWMGKYPITQKQWRTVARLDKINIDLNPTPSHFKGDNLPVEQVSWHEAVEFCDRLSAHPGSKYRLPTEAEWEYACRAGTQTPFYFGDALTTDQANYDGNGTTQVGTFPPNKFGLYDMHGNVWEWCQDTWHEDYLGAPCDGSAWLSANDNHSRLLRGGSWINGPRSCRSAFRLRRYPGDRLNLYGFRLVCEVSNDH